jgi:hypothetical protein
MSPSSTEVVPANPPATRGACTSSGSIAGPNATFCIERSTELFAAGATALVFESELFIAGHRYGCFGPSTGGSDLT